MKKVLTFLFALMLSAAALQVSAQALGEYQFSTGTDATKWITLTTTTSLLTPGQGDYGASTVQDIGFSFNFGGSTYTQFSVNTDGNLCFGSTATGTGYYSTPFSATNANYNSPKINMFGCDGFLADNGYIYHEVVGTAPDRICVIEFATSTYTSTSRSAVLKWQVQLFEGSNDIQIVYPSTAPSMTPAVGRQQGMCTDATDIILVNANHTISTYGAGVSTNNVDLNNWPDVDRYYLFTIPTDLCIRPGNLAVSNITTTSADFSWTPMGTESSWEVFITDVDSVPDENTVATATVTDTFYNIYGLTAATAYHAFVRANCGSSNSNWRSIDFFSACPDYATIPYQENFDTYGAGGAAYYPQCWSRLTNYSTQYPYISSSSAYSTPGNLYFYSSTYSSYYSMAVTPEIDTLTTPINTLTVNFLIKKTSTTTGYGALQIGVMTDPTDISTFTAVRTLTGSELTSTNAWYEIEVPMTSYAGYGSYFALYKPSDATGYTYIDNFKIYATPTCLKPVNVAVSNITDNSADVDWTPRNDESTWTVVVVPHGDDVTTGTPEYAYQHPYSISNLTDNTQYDVYVKSDCGGEESDWSNAATFTTKCLPTNQIPFVEDFATATYGTGTAAYPNCWTRHQIGTTSVYPYVSGTYGTGSLYFYSSTSIATYAASQALDLSQETPGSLVLSCDLYKTSSAYGRMDIGYMTDADDISTFVALKSVYPGDLELVSNWYTFNVVLPAEAYNNTNVYLAFVAPAGGTNYAYLDNVSLDYIPTCSDPSNLTISNVAGTSALVSWTAAEFGDPDYNVEYSEAGQENWTSVLVSGNTSVFLSGLTEQTAYDVRVTSECTDATVQPTPITGNFTTPCLAGGTVAVGNGTISNYNLPLNNFYNYTYSQQIFLSSEMNGATTINSVSFEYNYATAMSSKTNVNIYLKHTTKSAFTSTSDYESITGAQLVYSGNLNCTQGWNTFTFDSVFAYNGTDNLMLIVDDNSGGYNSSSYVFKAHSTGDYRSLYYYSDSNNPDPTNPTAVTTTSSYTSGNRNNVKFGGACDSVVTCVAPNAIVTAVDNESITIDWVAGNNETSWDLEYRLASDTDWTSEGTVTTAPYIISNLTSASAYQVRMRSNCGADYSAWKLMSATTECDPINVPYLQNFDGTTAGTGTMVPCWTRKTNNTSTAYPYLSTTQHNSGSNAVYFYATSTLYSYIASPRLADDVLMDSLVIQFQAYKTSATYFIEVGIMTDPEDYSTFVPVGSFSPSVVSTWELGEFRTSGYTGNGHYVAFRVPQWITNYMYIDDINIDYIPDCLHVNDIHAVASSITATDADITWTAGADETEWDYVYAPAGTITDPNDETINTTTTNPVSLSGLTGNTLYDVFVRANCSNGQSSTWMNASFRTACVAVSTLPYAENFDTYTGTTLTTTLTENNLPNCWSYINTATSSSGYWKYPVIYNSSSYAASGVNTLRFYTGTYSYYGDQYAIMPEIDTVTLPINTLQLSFDARAYSTSYITPLVIGVMSNPADASTFMPYDTITLSATTHSTYYVDFSNFTGNGNYITFFVQKPTSSPLYHACNIDNISLDIAPSCDAPTNLTVGTLTGSSADISWTDDPSQSAWEVYVFEEGQTPDFTQAVTASSNSYSATGLTQNTVYEIYVRTACSNGLGYSNWVHTSFMTISNSPAQTPYFHDFTDGQENAEWAIINGTQPNKWYIGVPTGETDSVLFISSTGTDESYNISSTSNVWAYRDIQFGTGAEFLLNFKWKAEGESCCDYMKVYIGSPAAVTAGTVTQPGGSVQLGGNMNVQTSWQTFSETFDGSYANTTKRLYFLWHNDGSVGTAPAAVVDSIEILVSECGKPINLTASNITTTSADISFTPAMTTDGAWEYVYGLAGINPDTETPTAVTTTSFNLSGLTSSSTYVLYVRTACANGGYSTWSDVLTFNTECEGINTLPYTENFDNVSGATTTAVSVNNLPNCWNNLSGTMSSYAGYPIVYSSSTYAASGSNAMRFYTYTSTSSNYGDQYGIMPVIDVTALPMNTLQVSFDARKNTTSYASFTLIVGVMSGTDATTFVGVDTLTITDATYNNYEVAFNNYTGTGNRIAFLAPMNAPVTYNTGYVDNIEINTIPTCPNPTSFAVSSVTNNTVSLSWNENGSATSWEIEYGQTGFTAGSGTVVTATTNPYTVTGLTSGTTYDFYLRSVCSASDYSNWRGPVSAQPGSYNIPTSGTTTVSMCGGTIYDDGGVNGDYSSSVNTTVIVNPETPGDMVQLQGTVDVEDDFDFLYIYDGSTSGTMLFSSANGTTVNVTSTTGPLAIVFTSDGSVVQSGFALTVSCVGGTTPTTCDAPTNVAAANITENAANITWTAGGTETAWNLQYKAASASTWSNSIAVTGTPSHNLTGLAAATAYDVRVQADCGAGETSTWATATFTTANAAGDPCEAPTNMTATGLTTESAVLDWNQADATVSGWTINYKKASDATWTTIDVTSHPFTLTGLEYNTTYNAKVAANCDGTLSDFTSAITFKTAGEGVNDYTLANSISLYPNPTSGEFRIQNAELRIDKVEVYDVYGKMLTMVEVNDNQVTMNASNYAAGMYFVRIYTANGTATKTFVKK